MIRIRWSNWQRLIISGALSYVAAHFLSAQDEGKIEPPLSRAEISNIEARSLEVLRNVSLTSSPQKAPRPLKMMETAAGTIRWGNLFSRDEVVALVNLAPASKTEPEDHPPQYLSLWAWKDGRWNFRQYLGNAYALEIHYRKDTPSAFLQGSAQFGRYDGEHLSWFYDTKSRTLKQTHFEDWGPFYLVGNYLVCTRGFERLAHDDTRWIYAYKNGRKGQLLALFHENDSGYFDITCRNFKSGKMESWHFVSDHGHDERTRITVREGVEEDGGAPEKSHVIGRAEVVTKGEDQLTQSYCFGLLTGLNPAVLGINWSGADEPESSWLDKLPPLPRLKRIEAETTGDPDIVARLQEPSPAQNGKK